MAQSLARLPVALRALVALVVALGCGLPVAAAQPAATSAPAAASAEPSQPQPSQPSEGASTAAAAGADAAATNPCPNCRKGRPGNVNPCNTPDEGWGVYDRWSGAPSIGQMIAPQSGGITKDGGFDLVVHFHGHEPIRKEFVKTAKGIVLVGVDLGIGSGPYGSAFASPDTFERLLDSVEKEMARRTGNKKAHVRKLALSSWSAGYGALEQILRQPIAKKVDALILLDSLHTGYVEGQPGKLVTAGLDPFVQFAKRAARGEKLMFQSYSSIVPPGYASTQEVAHYVVSQLGGKPTKATRDDVLGLQMFERFDRGNYHARGYRGDDKPDHCAHIGLMKSVVKSHLNKRWGPPLGKLKPPAAGAKGKDGKKKGATDKPAAPAQPVPPGATIHVVADGQSLGRIAKRYGVRPEDIQAANGLGSSSTIQPGQRLVIPPKPKSRAK